MKRKPFMCCLLVISMLALALTGCGDSTSTASSESSELQVQENTSSAVETVWEEESLDRTSSVPLFWEEEPSETSSATVHVNETSSSQAPPTDIPSASEPIPALASSISETPSAAEPAPAQASPAPETPPAAKSTPAQASPAPETPPTPATVSSQDSAAESTPKEKRSAKAPTTDSDVQQEETPTNAQNVVYYTRTGKKYHNENPCGRGIYYPCTLEEALQAGLEPCEKCVLH